VHGFHKWPDCVTVDWKELNTSFFPAGFIPEVRWCFNHWDAEVGSIKFKYGLVNNNIIPVFSGWPAAIDSAGGYTETYPTQGTITSFSIRINFDTYPHSNWSNTVCDPSKLFVKRVVLHEIGHGIGLTHGHCPGEIMDSTTTFGDCNTTFGQHDKGAVNFMYSCTRNHFIAFLTEGDYCPPCEDDPVAETSSLKIEDGIASWVSHFEYQTREYLLEATETPNGRGEIIAIEEPGLGEHIVALPKSKKRFIRLVEIDNYGRRTIRDVKSKEKSILTSQIAPHKSDEREFIPVHDPSDVKPPNFKQDFKAPLSTIPTYVIYTSSSLVPWIDGTIAAYRRLQGHVVDVVSTSSLPPGDTAVQIKNSITSYYQQNGTKYFHIVGNWSDDFTASVWNSSEFWRKKRDSYVRQRRDESLSGSVIPPFRIPGMHDDIDNSPYTAPYIYSDMPFADVNGDGIPDVVVTRWATDDYLDVQYMYAKIPEYENNPVSPSDVAFLVGDIHYGGARNSSADTAVVDEMTSELMSRLLELAPDQNVSRLNLSEHLISRNTDLADLINNILPSGIVISSTQSNPYQPGDFFDKTDSPAWSTSLLYPYRILAYVLASSCESANFLYDGDYSPPICNELLFDSYDRGAISWIGPTVNSLQNANYTVSKYMIEEMYTNPYQTIGDSWLRAMQRAYANLAEWPELLPTLDGYVFLGDPLTPLMQAPQTNISTYVRYSAGDGSEARMPDFAAVGCPAGDAEEVVIYLEINKGDVIGPLPDSVITISPPLESKIYFHGEAFADSAPTLWGDYYKTSITLSDISSANDTCGIDSSIVSIWGVPVGYATFNVKSYDIETTASMGKVILDDLGLFSQHYTSSQCDCKEPGIYKPCYDYAPPTDTTIDLIDFSLFSQHYGHQTSIPEGAPPMVGGVAWSNGSVDLRIEEDVPLFGERKLDVSVLLNDVEPFKLMFLSFKNENPDFDFRGWAENPSYPGRTICTEVVRNGQREIVLAVFGSKKTVGYVVDLGSFEIGINSKSTSGITEEDFKLETADIMSVMGSSLAIKSTQLSKTIEPIVYHDQLAQNYPNPFNPSTTIAFSLSKQSNVILNIYDVRGSLVKTVLSEEREAGIYKEMWDGNDNRGQSVASGVYFYRLRAGDFKNTKKMVLLR
jgi:hypothetical protein